MPTLLTIGTGVVLLLEILAVAAIAGAGFSIGLKTGSAVCDSVATKAKELKARYGPKLRQRLDTIKENRENRKAKKEAPAVAATAVPA